MQSITTYTVLYSYTLDALKVNKTVKVQYFYVLFLYRPKKYLPKKVPFAPLLSHNNYLNPLSSLSSEQVPGKID